MINNKNILWWKKIEQKHNKNLICCERKVICCETKLETELHEYCTKKCQLFKRINFGSIQNGSQLHAESCYLVEFYKKKEKINND